MGPSSNPDPNSSHVRIPVAGPEPFNTLVAVNESAWGPGKGFVTHNQSWVTNQLVFETDFCLIGYDPRNKTPYLHSTTVVMQHLGLSDDCAWQFSIDEVNGYFDGRGCWCVTATVVSEVPGPIWFDNPKVGAMGPYASSWVLCYEPPPGQIPQAERDPRFHRFIGED